VSAVPRRLEALSIALALALPVALVVAVRALGDAPRLALGGAIAVDGPAVFVAWTLALTAALACVLAAVGGRARAEVVPLGLAILAAAAWLLAACVFDWGCAAAAWAIGWTLCAASIARAGGADRLEAASKVQGMGLAGSLVLALAAVLLAALAGSAHPVDAAALGTTWGDSAVLARAVIRLLFVGLGLAAAWVPFHSWAPDAWTAAPRPVAIVIAVAAPACAVLALARVVAVLDPVLAELSVQWRGGWFALATLTTIVGGSLALVQRDAARLTAYVVLLQSVELAAALTGPVAEADLLLPAVAAHAAAVVPALLALGAWADAAGESTSMETLRGRGRRRPFASALWIASLALLAGFPGGARAVSRADLLDALAPADGFALLFAIATALQWAAVVRLAGVLWLEPPLEERRAPPTTAEQVRVALAWVVVVVALAAAIALATVRPLDVLEPGWSRLLLGG
jgi:NADH-quinone oxidoreductase subunit N